MRRFLTLLVTMLTLAGYVPALAVAKTQVFDRQETRRVLQFIGQCTVRREPDLARQFVQAAGDWKALPFERKRLIQSECLPRSSMVSIMTNDALLGTLAEAMIHADGLTVAANEAPKAVSLVYPQPQPIRTTDANGVALPEKRIEAQRIAIARKNTENARLRFGECIVRAAPSQSRALLDTPIDSEAELATLRSFSPIMERCLAAGESVGFSREVLRGAIAVAVYRLFSAGNTKGEAV